MDVTVRYGRFGIALGLAAATLLGLLLTAVAIGRDVETMTGASPPPLPGHVVQARHAPPFRSIAIVPADMKLMEGRGVKCGDAIPDPTVASWCRGVPEGTIILGVNPSSPVPDDWLGGTAEAEIDLSDAPTSTLAVVTIGWPRSGGKGIHSPRPGQAVTVTWNGVPIWSRRTLDAGPYGDFYAALLDDVTATSVITRAEIGSLKISVPPATAFDVSYVNVDLYPLDPGPLLTRMRGIAYSPYRDCQNPNWGPHPTADQVEEDLRALRHMSGGIRTYASRGISGEVARIAARQGLPVCAGAWLGREKGADGRPVANHNREEIDALVALAHEVPLECVIVGNEVLLRGDLTVTELVAYLAEVRERVKEVDVPVTTAEVGGHLRAHPELVDAVDLVMIHTYPSWGGQPIAGAAGAVVQDYVRWRDAVHPKPVVMGETGWPSAGPSNRQADMTMANQRRFLHEFLALAEEHAVAFYYFSAFDELWKTEGGVGGHWGLRYSDRSGKHMVQSVLLPARHFPSRSLYLPAAVVGARRVEQPARPPDTPPPPQTKLVVFDEYGSEENRFGASGWMGDYEDLALYECHRDDPHSGAVALRVDYRPRGDQGWAGVYWQHPDGNWGHVPDGGHDLSGARAVRFHARGGSGGEKVRFQVGGLWGPYPDSLQPAAATDLITLTPTWTAHEIDLRGRDLSRVVGGFAFVVDACANPAAITFFLDDIHFVTADHTDAPAPTATPAGEYAIHVYTDRDLSVGPYVPTGFMGDTGDLDVNECWRADVHSGSTAVRLHYRAGGGGPHHGCAGAAPCGWAAVAWQSPAHNWGDRPGGRDLTGAVALSLWAKGDRGGESVAFKVGGIGCGSGSPYPDSVCPAMAMEPSPVTLDQEWNEHIIPLPPRVDLSRVLGALTVSASADDNPDGAVVFLDDIRFLFGTDPRRWLLPHAVYVDGRLTEGYDMGVDSSRGRTDWLHHMDGFMRMAYPSGQSWGAVFLTVGPPVDRNRPGKDLSLYSTLSLELRGRLGGETVSIGIKDNTQRDDAPRTRQRAVVGTTWETYAFPLAAFRPVDLSRLYVVTEFVFEPGTPAQTVDFRNIRYLP